MMPKVGRFVELVEPELESHAPEWLCHILAERAPAGEPPAQVQGLLAKTRALNNPTIIAGDRLTGAKDLHLPPLMRSLG